MIFGLLESFNESPLLLYLGVVAVACVGGGIPPMLERRRRRAIENQLPTFLEALSDSVGAGRGLQEAMMEQSESNDGLLASLLPWSSIPSTPQGAEVGSTHGKQLIP